MRSKFKKSAAVISAVAAAALLASCSSSEPAGDASSAPGGQASEAPGEISGTVTFVSPDPEEGFVPVIEAFEAKYPGVEVQFQNIPFDQYNNVIQQRIGAGDAEIDVVLVDAGASAMWASRGWLLDLTEYLPQATENSVPASVEQSMWEGKLWALPMWTSAQYLYANLDLLEAAEVEAPTKDQRWTWEQLTEAAKKAQAAGAEWGVLFDQTDRYYQLQPLSESAGGGSGVTGEAMDTIDVTNEGWVRAMNWYASIFEDGVSPRGVTTDQMSAMFGAGQGAFFIGGSWSLTPITENNPGFEYTVLPNPYFEGGTPAMSTGSWSVGVSAHSDNTAAAKAFAEFVSQDVEGNKAVTEVILTQPTHVEAFDNFTVRIEEVDPPHTDGMGALTLSELQEAAVSRPNVIGFTQLQDVLGRAYADIRNGQPVEETLQNAQVELQGLWDRQ